MSMRALAISLLVSLACSTEKAPPPRTCCDQPKIPAGVTPFVVADEAVDGPSDGEKVKMAVGLSQPAKREQVYPVLHTLYRHAMTRRAFEPIQFAALVYADEASARRGGDGWVARISREQGQLGPRCENKVKYDFEEEVARAFAAANGRAEEEDPNDSCRLAEKKKVARPDEKFTRKPAFKPDAGRRAVEVTYPYLEMGKDEYVGELKFSSAMRDFTDYLTTFFRRVDDLKEMTFVGVHQDQPVLRVSVTREQFESKLSNLQEEIAAHAAVTFASLGMKRTDDKGAAKEQAAFHAKTYKAALASLPKNQVTVSSKLK